jgi:hypothetical protein
MKPENTAESDTTRSQPNAQEVKRRRRPQTSAEKAARQEKRLRDQYGNSRLDPDEPSLHGLNAAAILCALTLLRQAYRKGSGGKPKSIADKVARICTLSADHRALLLKWLTWAKPRRWVLLEERRSAVVAWSSSRPDKTVAWTAALDGQWRAKIQGVAASQEAEAAPREPSFTSSQPREPHYPSAPHLPQSGVDLPRSEPMSAAGLTNPAPDGSAEKNGSAYGSGLSAPSGGQSLPAASQPVERPRTATVATRDVIDRSKIARPPYPAFEDGRVTANNFAKAARNFQKGEGSAEDLKKAAGSLRMDVPACQEFCQRSANHREFVESIFSQLGWEVP